MSAPFKYRAHELGHPPQNLSFACAAQIGGENERRSDNWGIVHASIAE